MIVISPDRFSNRSPRFTNWRDRSSTGSCRSNLDPSMCTKARAVLDYVKLARVCKSRQDIWNIFFRDEFLNSSINWFGQDVRPSQQQQYIKVKEYIKWH